jgi:hypothetical protein
MGTGVGQSKIGEHGFMIQEPRLVQMFLTMEFAISLGCTEEACCAWRVSK